MPAVSCCRLMMMPMSGKPAESKANLGVGLVNGRSLYLISIVLIQKQDDHSVAT